MAKIQCTGCGSELTVEPKALGKAIRCPDCGIRLSTVSKVKPVDEDEDEDFEDDDADDRQGLTPNRVRGIIGMFAAGGIVAATLLIPKFQLDELQPLKIACFVISGLLVVSGVYYLIRG